MEAILKKVLLDCFDDDIERDIVRSLFRGFEKELNKVVREWSLRHDKLVTQVDQLIAERDFFRSQFEQVTKTGEHAE
ncbi:hypothetical protein J1C56_02405 [Aminobacter anthyllidis]|uniref:Uncharacterized protein n=1 Tax=Aminobacter anthyllidis TaxID=1035067 RepID=A0A9X1A7D5_9HYPH|nr:hypothetical protein [Aminobacter anthyllidis]MBT1154436.1 hypothetical protein [Aminobacter anthyllidis]